MARSATATVKKARKATKTATKSAKTFARKVSKTVKKAATQTTRRIAGKRVYFFGPGKSEGGRGDKQLLGGKGANLADMTSAGLPVPPGFTITTETCAEY